MIRILEIKQWLILLLLVMMELPAFAAGVGNGTSMVTLEIPTSITVSGSQLYLSDLGVVRSGQSDVSNYLRQVELGPVPIPGQQRVLNRDYLNAIVKQYRFPFTIQFQMGDTVVVKSLATRIEAESIQKAIDTLVAGKKTYFLKRWVEIRNIPEKIIVSPGEWKIEASFAGNPVEVGPVLFKVILTKGTESRVLNISGKLRATARVYRASRNISYQSVINSSDFELVEMELESGKEYLGEIQSGNRVTKLIRQGEILRKDWVQPLPLVSKAQEVKVIVKDENVAISILATAKSDGWLGDEIMIINPFSHKMFKTRVTGKGTVELNL